MTYQPPMDEWRASNVSRPMPSSARKALGPISGWLAHGLFHVSIFVSVVILPISMLVLVGRLVFG